MRLRPLPVSNGIGLILAGLLILAPAVEGATVILQAESVTTDMGTEPSIDGSGVFNLIDQSGLSVGYTSGVDNFDAYLAGSPEHNNSTSTVWQSDSVQTGNVDFDLGGIFLVEEIAFWNIPFNGSAVTQVQLFASNDPTFENAIDLGVFMIPYEEGPSSLPAELLDIADTSAQFVRIEVQENFDDAPRSGFAEVAFGVVPEPSASLLACTALVVLAALRRVGAGNRFAELRLR
jgi:hypothetical protein